MKHLFMGRCAVLDKDGKMYEQEYDEPNFLAQEGEQSILNTYLLGQSNPSKYLALLNATPTTSTTMATMSEFLTPGSNGYNRVQINSGDWTTPLLQSGNYQSNSGIKTFGPASGANWTGITYVAVVTTASGTGGKFIAAIPLPSNTPGTILIGQSFTYLLTSICISA